MTLFDSTFQLMLSDRAGSGYGSKYSPLSHLVPKAFGIEAEEERMLESNTDEVSTSLWY